jgi:hypothetical protein
MDLAYPPGYSPHDPGPLARFLPPLEQGSTIQVLKEFAPAGGTVLDPFGASPRLILEAAQSGYAVIVAANNPVTRFVLRHTLEPFPVSALQAALARIAAAPKDETRIEPFLNSLYLTECARCAAPVTAEFFIWNRDEDGPAAKVYACDRCNYAGESSTTDEDWGRAHAVSRRGLQHALALEQVAARGDPDRSHAEAALAVYPGRALFALITLVNKISQLGIEPALRPAADALLLSAFNDVNALWGYPEGRSRPRQLSASPRFREGNVWSALEGAVSTWAMDPTGVTFQPWPGDAPPDAGTVAIFPGSLRDLTETLADGSVDVLLTVLPRPNQAYWTLSALWAAWLWGREAAAPIKVALRRRRYDWAWHSTALHTVMAWLIPFLTPEIPVLALLPEAEPGFIAAALAGFDRSGFELTGRALRVNEGQAFLRWRVSSKSGPRSSPTARRKSMRSAAEAVIAARAEPAPFALVHAAAWSDLAGNRVLAQAWEQDGGPPLTSLSEALETVLGDRDMFVHLGRGAEPESGQYDLAAPSGDGSPLADRVEAAVLAELRAHGERTIGSVDEKICRLFNGLQTPDKRLVYACVQSYATEDVQAGVWRLRDEDEADRRVQDCEEISSLLETLGTRLGYDIERGETIVWTERGTKAFEFRVLETASFGSPDSPAGGRLVFVVPGGRAVLVAEKTRRNPALKAWLEQTSTVIKFRHVRRLAAEAGLTREGLLERLAIDPPQHHDPQLPLL